MLYGKTFKDRILRHFTTLHKEATQENPYLLLIQIVPFFLIKKISFNSKNKDLTPLASFFYLLSCIQRLSHVLRCSDPSMIGLSLSQALALLRDECLSSE